jgi:hypothetical protein
LVAWCNYLEVFGRFSLSKIGSILCKVYLGLIRYWWLTESSGALSADLIDRLSSDNDSWSTVLNIDYLRLFKF